MNTYPVNTYSLGIEIGGTKCAVVLGTLSAACLEAPDDVNQNRD